MYYIRLVGAQGELNTFMVVLPFLLSRRDLLDWSSLFPVGNARVAIGRSLPVVPGGEGRR
jgi:hypothetical protein